MKNESRMTFWIWIDSIDYHITYYVSVKQSSNNHCFQKVFFSISSYSAVTGNENADFTRCVARKAMDMFERMGRICPFVSQPKILPVGFRSTTSYVLSFFANAMALIAHA